MPPKLTVSLMALLRIASPSHCSLPAYYWLKVIQRQRCSTVSGIGTSWGASSPKGCQLFPQEEREEYRLLMPSLLASEFRPTRCSMATMALRCGPDLQARIKPL